MEQKKLVKKLVEIFCYNNSIRDENSLIHLVNDSIYCSGINDKIIGLEEVLNRKMYGDD